MIRMYGTGQLFQTVENLISIVQTLKLLRMWCTVRILTSAIVFGFTHVITSCKSYFDEVSWEVLFSFLLRVPALIDSSNQQR
jgi:hypothetical protein